MTYKLDNDNSSNRNELLEILKENEIDFSFNSTPERFISRSLTQTKLKKYLDCPSCFFTKSKKEIENNEDLLLSNTVHFLADYLFRNKDKFPNSHSVLDFINFNEGNFLEMLKTDDDNLNYDILKYLAEIEKEEIRQQIIRSTLIVYGTIKRLGFEETRKNDSISLNLKNTSNKISLTFYAKPDLTGRHKTVYPKSGRKYDNFLIDYKLNFSKNTKSNTIQMAFYYLTHALSKRKINNYLILDISSGNLYQMKNINLDALFKVINRFLILKNLNYRGKNKNHKCENVENTFQENFLDNLDIENFGESFGSKTYNDLLLNLKLLEESLEFIDLGQVVQQKDIDKILSLYPIKN